MSSAMTFEHIDRVIHEYDQETWKDERPVEKLYEIARAFRAHLADKAGARVDGWEVDVSDKSISLRSGDGRKANIRRDIGLTYNDRVVIEFLVSYAKGCAHDQTALRDLYLAYVRLLEAGRDRIRDLGGECDAVDVMERDDPALIRARSSLEASRVNP